MTKGNTMTEAAASRRPIWAALIAIVFAMSCLIALSTPSPAQALTTLKEGTTFKSSNVTYKVTDLDSYGRGGEITLMKYDSYRTTPIVNTVYYRGHRLRVTRLENNSFNTTRGRKITRVTLGENVESIGARAFYKCSKLNNINLRKCAAINVSYNHGMWEADTVDIGWDAFRGVSRKVTVQCGLTSNGGKSVYKTLLEAKGLPSTAKIKY